MITPVFEIRSKRLHKKEFSQKLQILFSNQDTATKLQHYPVLRIVNYNTCGNRMSNDDVLCGEISYNEVDSILKCIKKHQVYNIRINFYQNWQPFNVHSHISPKNTAKLIDLCAFSRNCTLLEKVTLISNNHQEYIDIKGHMMKVATNLKEIIMDGVKLDFSLTLEPCTYIKGFKQSQKDFSISSLLQEFWACFTSTCEMAILSSRRRRFKRRCSKNID